MRSTFSFALIVATIQLAANADEQVRYPTTQLPAYASNASQSQVLPPSQVVSQDIRFAELSQRLAALESHVSTSATAVQQASFTTGNPDIDCGSICFEQQERSIHWFSGAELTILRPSFSTIDLSIDDDSSAAAPRLFLGRENAQGNGIRAIFWWLDADSDVEEIVPAFDLERLNTTAYRYDVDFYHRFLFDDNSLLFGSGLSGGGVRYRFDDLIEVVENGVGLSVFAEGRYVSYRSEKVECALITRGRWAYYTGAWEDNNTLTLERGDSRLNVAEVGFASEVTKKFKNWDLIFRFGIEAQHWDTQMYNGISFYGSTFRLGANW